MTRKSTTKPKEPEFTLKTEPWTTSRGVKVILKSMPPFMITRISDSVEMPKKPTYSVETASGDIEEHFHEVDEAKGINTLETDEDKKAWAEYTEVLDTAEGELTYRTLKAVLSEGVDVQYAKGQMEAWTEKQEYIGVEVPTTPFLRDAIFKELEVVGGNEDMEYILKKVMELTGISPEEIAAAKSSFPGKVEPEP